MISAMKGAQRPTIDRTNNGINPSVGFYYSQFNTASNNATGVLAGTSTTQGVVPDDTTPGCPPIESFNGQTGYLAAVEIDFGLNPGGRFRVSDLLFKSGAHNFNATDTLASQPSYAARLPGTDYTQTEIWIEVVTAFTGTPTFTITYTNEVGTAGQSTTFTMIGTGVALQMLRAPLAAGDRGVQKIESVTCTVATVGTFNVLVLRNLMQNMKVGGEIHGQWLASFAPDLSGMPIVFETSALYYQFQPDAVGTITPHGLAFTIIRG